MPAAPSPRPLLSTLAALSVAPPPSAQQAGTAPRALFPLIEALDMPGGLLARGLALTHHRDAAEFSQPAEPAPKQTVPAPPAILAAAEIDLPLAELLRLLAADPAESSEAFLALRRPMRAERFDT